MWLSYTVYHPGAKSTTGKSKPNVINSLARVHTLDGIPNGLVFLTLSLFKV